MISSSTNISDNIGDSKIILYGSKKFFSFKSLNISKSINLEYEETFELLEKLSI